MSHDPQLCTLAFEELSLLPGNDVNRDFNTKRIIALLRRSSEFNSETFPTVDHHRFELNVDRAPETKPKVSSGGRFGLRTSRVFGRSQGNAESRSLAEKSSRVSTTRSVSGDGSSTILTQTHLRSPAIVTPSSDQKKALIPNSGSFRWFPRMMSLSRSQKRDWETPTRPD